MPEGTASNINTRGIPSRTCLNCDCDIFKILVRFDEDGDVAWHTTNGYCHGCHAPVTVLTPVDTVDQMIMEFPDEY